MKKKVLPESGRKGPTSFNIDPVLKRDVHLECVRRGISQTQAIEDALRMWLGTAALGVSTSPQSPARIPPEDSDIVPDGTDADIRPWVEKLLYILKYGRPKTQAAIITNLDTFEELTALWEMASSEEPAEDAAEWERTLREIEGLIRASESSRCRPKASGNRRKKMGGGPDSRTG